MVNLPGPASSRQSALPTHGLLPKPLRSGFESFSAVEFLLQVFRAHLCVLYYADDSGCAHKLDSQSHPPVKGAYGRSKHVWSKSAWAK